MSKFIKRLSKKFGLPPGSLMYIGERNPQTTSISILDYDANAFQERKSATLEDCSLFRESSAVTWININGLKQIEVIERIGSIFNIHPLVLEDILQTGQMPKLEDLGDNIFVIVPMLYFDPQANEIFSEQFSIIIGPNYVVSFQEREGDFFDTIRERIRTAKGRVRKMGADYLAYALLDAIVDHYFVLLEGIGDDIEELEEDLLQPNGTDLAGDIHHLRREMIFLRKQIWPVREVISAFMRSESKLVTKVTTVYLKDIHDHSFQVIDSIESYRDIIAGMHDIYLSNVSHRMNEVMKVLTVISTIFIPLTFIAGVYGMNFRYMPELEWQGSYFIVLGVMGLLGGTMYIYFRRKKWI